MLSHPVQTLLAIALSGTVLAACGGSDQPKVSSSEWLKKCEQGTAKSTAGRITEAQIAAVCKCSQRKLTEQGFGDRRNDDPALKGKGRPIGRDCALEVLAGK